MVPFVSQQLNNLDLALSMAKRGNLPGAEGLIAQQFERLFAAGQHKEAAECAAESPQVGCQLEYTGEGSPYAGPAMFAGAAVAILYLLPAEELQGAIAWDAG